MLQEIPVTVQLAGIWQAADDVLAVDRVNEHSFAVNYLAVVNEIGNEGDDPHLSHDGRIEGDLLHAAENSTWGGRVFQPLARRQTNKDDIARLACIDYG